MKKAIFGKMLVYVSIKDMGRLGLEPSNKHTRNSIITRTRCTLEMAHNAFMTTPSTYNDCLYIRCTSRTSTCQMPAPRIVRIHTHLESSLPILSDVRPWVLLRRPIKVKQSFILLRYEYCVSPYIWRHPLLIIPTTNWFSEWGSHFKTSGFSWWEPIVSCKLETFELNVSRHASPW